MPRRSKQKNKLTGPSTPTTLPNILPEEPKPIVPMVKVKTAVDGAIFDIDFVSIGKQSKVFKNLIGMKELEEFDVTELAQPIVLHGLIKRAVELVMEWANAHKEDDPDDHYDILEIRPDLRPRNFKGFDKRWITGLQEPDLRLAVYAAEQLEIPKLEHLCIYKKSLELNGKSAEESRQILGVPASLTEAMMHHIWIQKKLRE